MGFAGEFMQFLKERRKLWLLPLVLMLGLCTGFVALTQAAAIAPFIYALF
jgi:hypothetical protein